MTAQRLVRGSKARIIAIFCAIVFCVGILVLLQKNQAQLENVNKNYAMCVQQQESLSGQLQVIVDYKSRLEKSLQLEKNENKQTRTELESRINDEKTRRDKTSMEANLRFQSLQQHYKLLQTKHEDLKEKSDKLQQQYLEESDKLQSKVREIQEQLKQSENNKENSLKHLKTLYLQLQVDKDRLAEQLKTTNADYAKWESDKNHLMLKNHQLQRELDSLRSHSIHRRQESSIPSPPKPTDHKIATTKKFAKQVEVSSDVYEIRDRSNKPLNNQPLSHQASNTQEKPEKIKPLEKSLGPEIKDSELPQVDAPQLQIREQKGPEAESPNNFVLLKPSSPSKSTSSASGGRLGNAHPLLVPTVTPSGNSSHPGKIGANFEPTPKKNSKNAGNFEPNLNYGGNDLLKDQGKIEGNLEPNPDVNLEGDLLKDLAQISGHRSKIAENFGPDPDLNPGINDLLKDLARISNHHRNLEPNPERNLERKAGQNGEGNEDKNGAGNVLPLPNIPRKKLPPGVVPIPREQLQNRDYTGDDFAQKADKASNLNGNNNNNGIPDEINLALPNRYRNNIIESELANEILKETKVDPKLQNEPELNMGLDVNQQDNAAMEVVDQIKPAQEDPLHLMDEENAGAVENEAKPQGVGGGKEGILDGKKGKKMHIDGLRGLDKGNGEHGAIRGALYENEGDYDKDVQKEDLQIEEAEPDGEEDDDGDDYDGHLAARQKDPAVRN